MSGVVGSEKLVPPGKKYAFDGAAVESWGGLPAAETGGLPSGTATPTKRTNMAIVPLRRPITPPSRRPLSVGQT